MAPNSTRLFSSQQELKTQKKLIEQKDYDFQDISNVLSWLDIIIMCMVHAIVTAMATLRLILDRMSYFIGLKVCFFCFFFKYFIQIERPLYCTKRICIIMERI